MREMPFARTEYADSLQNRVSNTRLRDIFVSPASSHPFHDFSDLLEIDGQIRGFYGSHFQGQPLHRFDVGNEIFDVFL